MTQNHSGAQAARSIDAARADPRLWPDALAQVARFLDASFAALVSEDRASALMELRYSTAARREWIAEYLRRHRRLDPIRARALATVGTGRAFSSADFISAERFRRSALFQRWMEPFGLIDVFGAVLHRSQTGVCMFIALRDAKAGPVDEETKRRLSTLLPHLSRAIQSGRVEESPKAQLAELFACLAAPILIVDEKLRISYSNASAETMLAMHPALSAAKGFLVVGDPRAREALENALDEKGRANKGPFAIMLESGAERCCVMHVLPLSQGGAALFVRSLSIGSGSVGPASDLYGLTARESSVLLCITEVGGVPATARALGLSEGTVKGYLKSIFQKTGAERQADLVKVALALESPFR